MTSIQQQATAGLGIWRTVMWAVLAAVLACPLVAMRFTDQVQWDVTDFVAGAALLGFLGVAVELTFFWCRRSRTRSMIVGASVAAVMLIWADAAVGIF